MEYLLYLVHGDRKQSKTQRSSSKPHFSVKQMITVQDDRCNSRGDFQVLRGMKGHMTEPACREGSFRILESSIEESNSIHESGGKLMSKT